MNRQTSRGQAIAEFSFMVLFLMPLLLGTIGIGVNLIKALEVNQLARDAGSMYAHGLNLSQPGNQSILLNIGSSLGLQASASASTAVLYLSQVTYVDAATCQAAGYTLDASGNPPNTCSNYQKWVFEQRLVLGNSSIHKSDLGDPTTLSIWNSTTGQIPMGTASGGGSNGYVNNTGARAQFSGINPYANVSGVVSGLPSGQVIYVAEAAAKTWAVPPFFGGGNIYSSEDF